MGVEGTTAEMVAQGKRTSDAHSVTEFFRKSPFLFLSLIFHIVVLLLLTFITAQTYQPPQPEIQVNIENLETESLAPQPVQREGKISDAATESAFGGRGPALQSETHQDVVDNSKDVTVEAVRGGDMTKSVNVATPESFEDQGDESIFRPTATRRSEDVHQAVDQFAVASINAMIEGKTLVVLMVDRSRSVVYGDLPDLIERMNTYFDQIDANLPVEFTGQKYWQVVSYGQRPRFVGSPSTNVKYIKNALSSIRIDTSGQENVAKAIKMVTDKFGDSDYNKILIACMTDEAGDDINNPVILQSTINRLKRSNAHFYVFGHEAVFCARKKRIKLTLNPEKLREADRPAVRGFEGSTIHGWADGGPAAPRPELWWTDNWHHWHRWGATLNGIKSGFGMYALNRIAMATQGTYFILKDAKESPYDQRKMFARYHPDISTVFEYDKRNKNVELRSVLTQTWDKIGRFYLDCDLRTDKQVRHNLQLAQEGRQYCIAQAKAINQLLHTANMSDANNQARWIAHAELTRAELLRLRFMLGQYHLTLKKAAQEYGGNLRGRKKRILMRRGSAPDDYKGPKQAKKEHSLAKEYIQVTRERHEDTPWAVLAQRMTKKIFPWRAMFADYPEKRPDGYQPPPNLEF